MSWISSLNSLPPWYASEKSDMLHRSSLRCAVMLLQYTSSVDNNSVPTTLVLGMQPWMKAQQRTHLKFDRRLWSAIFEPKLRKAYPLRKNILVFWDPDWKSANTHKDSSLLFLLCFLSCTSIWSPYTNLLLLLLLRIVLMHCVSRRDAFLLSSDFFIMMLISYHFLDVQRH